MPTPDLKIVINGEIVDPIKKEKLPLSVDWQARAKQLKAEAKAKAEDVDES